MGSLCLSPIKPDFLPLVAVSTEGHDDEAGHPERVNLAYGFECPLTQHEAIDTLSLGKRWSVCFYILEDDLRPIATFIPGNPSATRYRHPPITFWDPARRRSGAKAGAVDADDGSGAPWGLDDDDDEKEGEQPMFEEFAPEVLEFEASLDSLEPDGGEQPDDPPDGGGSDSPGLAPEPPVAGASSDPPIGAEWPAGGHDGEPLPLPPPPDAVPGAPVVERVYKGRKPPDIVYETEAGVLCYYESNTRFVATCSNALHGNGCVLTRFRSKRAHMQGRPVCFLQAWLTHGPLHDSKADHWAVIPELASNLQARKDEYRELLVVEAGRRLLEKQLCLPDGAPDPEAA